MGRSAEPAILMGMKAAALSGAEDVAERTATPRRTGTITGTAETKEAYDSVAETAA